MKKYFNLRLDSEVHKLAKIIAAIEDKGLQEYIEESVIIRIKADYPDVYKKIQQQKEDKADK
jgi:predicted HicB family RNase H-like nuclease